MTNPFFKRAPTLRRLNDGPLAPYIDAFAALMKENGYARKSAQAQIRLVSNLSRWMQRRHIEIARLRRPMLQQFLENLQRSRPCGHIHRGEHAPLNTLFGLLLRNGVVTDDVPAIKNPHHDLEQAYIRYLTEERALAPGTRTTHLHIAHHFLQELRGPAKSKLAHLRLDDIIAFVLRRARAYSRGHVKIVSNVLRSFLRFLYLRGQISTNLALSVPSVAHWRMTTIPKSFSPKQIDHLLKRCDQTSIAGRRDYALLLLLTQLGLRSGEVAAMTLDDIDWEAGELLVRGKGPRQDRLPLPRNVGKALAAYVCRDRPRSCPTRNVFVCVQAPRHAVANSGTISSIVTRALARANLQSPCKGAQILRHSLATNMLRRGASLAEIGDVLRHRSPNTTQIYAKVDMGALRTLVQPWPRGAV